MTNQVSEQLSVEGGIYELIPFSYKIIDCEEEAISN